MSKTSTAGEGAPRRPSPFAILLAFLKVGVIGFGGGSALIPIIEEEIVNSRQAMDETDYLKHTVVANITPGTLPTKLGATCGYQLAGVPGALAGAYGATLPGVAATVLIMALFPLMGEQAVALFRYASVGISVFIVMLLVNYVLKTCGNSSVNWALCVLGFLLTCGKELRQLAAQLLAGSVDALPPSLFDLSTIHLMIVTLMLIIFVSLKPKNWQLGVAGIWAAVYCLCCGKLLSAHVPEWTGAALVAVYLCAAGAFVLTHKRKSTGSFSWSVLCSRKFLCSAAAFLAVPLAIGAVCVLLCGGTCIPFLGNVALSTVTSFGGGEAYVSVADGFFVQSGYILPNDYYTQLVPVANALPGPILVKIAAGVGFLFGAESFQGAAGVCLAAACTALSVGVCCCLALVVLQMYQSIENSPFIGNLKAYILPVICGMLLSTSCSMFYEASRITSGKNIPALPALAVMTLGVFLLRELHRRFHIHDLLLLLGSASMGLVFLLIL